MLFQAGAEPLTDGEITLPQNQPSVGAIVKWSDYRDSFQIKKSQFSRAPSVCECVFERKRRERESLSTFASAVGN